MIPANRHRHGEAQPQFRAMPPSYPIGEGDREEECLTRTYQQGVWIGYIVYRSPTAQVVSVVKGDRCLGGSLPPFPAEQSDHWGSLGRVSTICSCIVLVCWSETLDPRILKPRQPLMDWREAKIRWSV